MFEQFVKNLLPFAFCTESAGGFVILANHKTTVCLVTGAKNERAAWYKAAKMLGMDYTAYSCFRRASTVAGS